MAAVSATIVGAVLGSVAARQTAASQLWISIGGHNERSLRDSKTVQCRSQFFSHSAGFPVFVSTVVEERVRLPRAAPVSEMFILPDLPYPLDGLEPHISRQTLEFHWGKHHRAYVDNLNKQVENTDLQRNTLDEIVKISYNNGNPSPAFNNAGQAWNHDFYWSSMKPGGGGKPEGELMTLIERDFRSYETFLAEFKQAATSQFGSGWAWLVANKAKLEIVKTPNAINPLIWGQVPLLVIDVWEHAYYLDFQNRRPDYVTTFINNLVNWDAAEERLARAKAFMNFGEPNIPEL